MTSLKFSDFDTENQGFIIGSEFIEKLIEKKNKIKRLVNIESILDYATRHHKNSMITEDVFMKMVSTFKIVKY